MLCTDKGLSIKKAELAALLAFAAKGKDRPHLAVVQFIVDDDRCWAYATDGHRALEGDGESDGEHHNGKWLIVRQFLVEGYKLLKKGNSIRLEFSGATLNLSTIVDKDGLEVSTFQWPKDAANAQQTFPEVRDLVRIPDSQSRSRVVTLNSSYFSDVTKVARAADKEAVDFYTPEDPMSPVYFRVQKDLTTTWTGVIMPMRSEASEAA